MDHAKLCAALMALMLCGTGAAAAAAGGARTADSLTKAALAAARFETNTHASENAASVEEQEAPEDSASDDSSLPEEPPAAPPEEAPANDSAPEEEPAAAKSCEIPTEKPSAQALAAIPYPADTMGSDGRVEKTHYGPCTGEQYFDLAGGGQVRNCTELENSFLSSISGEGPEFSFDFNEGEPVVLIYHTHTTESFEPDDSGTCDTSFPSKTTDPDKNVVAVGDRICAELDRAGIPYIHDTLIHDYPSYNDAYDSSRATVSQLLAHYPSVKIVLDIHRDGIEREDGTRVSPVAEIDGREAAQVMIISGCDDGTMGMPRYLWNFRFACTLQSAMESRFEGLTRPILFDYRHYNQDLTTGSLLIEVGSHGNSLDQALYSGELVGRALAALFGGEK